MQGPLDEPIANPPEKLTASPSTADSTAETPRKPPGGKALQRLLDLLEPRGFDEAVRATIEIAVPDEGREDFQAQMALRSASPTGAEYPEAASKAGGRKKRPRRGEPADEAEPEGAKTASTPEVATEYIEAAQSRAPSAPPSDALADFEGAPSMGPPIMGPPTATGPQWRSLGPWTIPNGQTYGSSRVNVSGRVSCVAVDPSNAAHVLCGSAAGGVWESFDRGASWRPRTDYAATLTVGALAFDRLNPRVVYCGTGEGNFYWPLGAGILRSVDGGQTWSTRCTAPFVGQGFYELIVDPANSNHLLAGTTGGLYVSNDGGLTWIRRRASLTWSISMAAAGGPAAEILAVVPTESFSQPMVVQPGPASLYPVVPPALTALPYR